VSVEPFPAWTTVTVNGDTPATVTVILAVRAIELGFAVQLAVSVPVPVPVAGILHHAASLVAFQFIFAFIENAAEPPAAAIFWLDGDMVRTFSVPLT
jgi:hypothetical protein